MPGENRAALAPSASSIKMADLEPIPDRKDSCNPCDNPIGTRLSPMCPVRSVTYVSGPDIWLFGGRTRTRTLDPLIKSPTPRVESIMVFSQPRAKAVLMFQSVGSRFPTDCHECAKKGRSLRTTLLITAPARPHLRLLRFP